MRLRNQLELPDSFRCTGWTHDRGNPVSPRIQKRGAGTGLFEKRQVQKEYECVSAAEPAPGHAAVDFPVVVRNRMTKSRSYLWPSGRRRTQRRDPDRTAEDLRRPRPGNARRRYPRPRARRRPRAARCTGWSRTRQDPPAGVRVASLGLGIVNDAFYPELLDKAPDDYSKPLQLLARGIRFVDPTPGARGYRSGLELSEARYRHRSVPARPAPRHGPASAGSVVPLPMDFGNADGWGDAIYFWIIPFIGDAIFPLPPSENGRNHLFSQSAVRTPERLRSGAPRPGRPQ